MISGASHFPSAVSLTGHAISVHRNLRIMSVSFLYQFAPSREGIMVPSPLPPLLLCSFWSCLKA